MKTSCNRQAWMSNSALPVDNDIITEALYNSDYLNSGITAPDYLQK